MKRRHILTLPLQPATLAGLAGLSPWLAAAADPALPHTALVMGNDAYGQNARLTNAGNDAKLMHETLGKLGAKSQLHLDLNASAISQKIEQYVKTLRTQPGVAWFYFSGHGVQLEGRNYLVGTEAVFSTPQAVRSASFDLESLFGLLEQVKPVIAIVVVDACRNNPFVPPPSQTRSVPAKGLAAPPERAGFVVAYSTAPYSTSQDWPNAKNGPYTSALSKALLARPRSLEDALKETSDAVYRATQQKQAPEHRSSLRREVWLEQTGLSVRALPGPAVAGLPAPANPGKASRDTTVAASRYRADLKISPTYTGVSADDWAMELYRIELMAKKMDRFEARSALSAATGSRATDHQITLAGWLLEEGILTEKNRQRAASLYQRAALRGYVPAQTLLGELQYERQNYSEAYKWLSEAAQSGYGRPKADLAQMMLFGQGTQQDPQQAMRMLMDSLKGFMPPNTPIPDIIPGAR